MTRGVTIHHGDALDVLPLIADDSIDAVVTDPPYELGFMGRAWDASGIAYNVELWKQCFRALKPGGHLLAFGGTRTAHRLAVAVEDAGFEIRDSIVWIYGSGFPKSLDVSKAIDKAAGAEREVIGDKLDRPGYHLHGHDSGTGAFGHGLSSSTTETRAASALITAPATDDAKRWAGWGTALKPAHEPIVVARKPLVGTVAVNVLAHGTGALNIDACRVAHASDADLAESLAKNPGRDDLVTSSTYGADRPQQSVNTAGRWPTNVVLSHAGNDVDGDLCADGCIPGCPVRELDEQSETCRPGERPARRAGIGYHDDDRNRAGTIGHREVLDGGGASRFFPVFRYQAKAPTRERPKIDGVAHPTVKPLELMRWLVRLVTQPDGLVLDPFAGSGTTAEACALEGMRCVAIEREADYLKLINARLAKHQPASPPAPQTPQEWLAHFGITS